jgi:lipid II:glycine glycyltransferase (peptidoglycan interpeptide bridge formation enzyme)
LALQRAQRRDPVSRLYLMARHLGDRFAIVIGRVDGLPAASAVVLLGRTTRYTRGATDVEVAGRTGAPVAVQWAAIGLARRFGSTSYNMGESGEAPGLAAFKEGFGAKPVRYGEYRIERLPFTRADQAARRTVKRMIGFVE